MRGHHDPPRTLRRKYEDPFPNMDPSRALMDGGALIATEDLDLHSFGLQQEQEQQVQVQGQGQGPMFATMGQEPQQAGAPCCTKMGCLQRYNASVFADVRCTLNCSCCGCAGADCATAECTCSDCHQKEEEKQQEERIAELWAADRLKERPKEEESERRAKREAAARRQKESRERLLREIAAFDASEQGAAVREAYRRKHEENLQKQQQGANPQPPLLPPFKRLPGGMP